MQEVGWGFHGLLVCFGVFLMLRWMILKKVQGCCPYLVSNSSHRGGGGCAGGTSCPLHHPLPVDVGLACRVLVWEGSPLLGR
jgi:hypothetical protein